ncbi:sugar ABC transporter permease [Cellulosilyticum sp. ST5]|uniref:ABC-type transporter, integral membrane subunit n=1 Tax=Cellulosilyticum lentocellum (strain ATCC 49066 / DSM 5427 / NCIMB 11756 / RHM5) TaxID=642492 RepID=F2JQL9_CELLD|nr:MULTISPECIES: sugar ABC transporter permease [Cellulosilyticum]ADZ85003.1 ABC-type transporter, integral membrane subunit [Cellulosilyticum lentocellum DSM 5427]QEH70475.1 sugar ABC transporter permease [Cellulosilyticum sp. WCF-2]
MLRAVKPKGRTIALYLFIPVVWYTFAVFVPLITAMFYSFFEWKGGPSKTFIGLENYVSLFKDKIFWGAFINNIYIVIACIIGQIGIAFVVVLMVNSRLAKLKGIHRTFAFFPSTVSAVCIGFIWMMIYDYKRGVLNWVLEAIGREDLTRVWLNEPGLVLLLVCIPLIWQFIGYYMVILLSAIGSVDSEIFEVAELDGASAFQRAIYIVLPLIKNTVLVCVTLCVAGNMKVFDHIYTMTKGGPGNSSMVMAMYGYQVSFSQQNMGYGSAISVGIFVVSLLVIVGVQVLVNLLMKDKGVE